MSLNPIVAIDRVIGEYRDHLQSEYCARDRTLRLALETELNRQYSKLPWEDRFEVLGTGRVRPGYGRPSGLSANRRWKQGLQDIANRMGC